MKAKKYDKKKMNKNKNNNENKSDLIHFKVTLYSTLQNDI